LNCPKYIPRDVLLFGNLVILLVIWNYLFMYNLYYHFGILLMLCIICEAWLLRYLFIAFITLVRHFFAINIFAFALSPMLHWWFKHQRQVQSPNNKSFKMFLKIVWLF
jgi:hypothetical protein